MQDVSERLEPFIQKRIIAIKKLERSEARSNSFQYDPRQSMRYSADAYAALEVIEGIIRTSLMDEKTKDEIRQLVKRRITESSPG